MAEYAGHTFVRCPVLSLHPRAADIACMVRDGVWTTLPGADKRRLTAKLATALRYCHEYVLKFQEAPRE